MAYFDNYGIEFSDDKKTLIRCPKYFTGSYIVPDEVENIGDSAFRDCTDLTSIIISNSVTRIGGDSFYGCIRLDSISIGYKVKSVGRDAFEGCEALAYVNIGSISSWCEIIFEDPQANPLFYAHNLYCDGNIVDTLLISDFTSTIGSYAFYGCESLECVHIPNRCQDIGNYAFYACKSLTHVFVGNNSITSIGDSAFSMCSALTSFVIPVSVNSLGCYAFQGCSQLAAVFIPNSIINIPKGTFFECISLISVIIPTSVSTIGAYAFSGCKDLRAVILPDGVKDIGCRTFAGCCRLSSIVIPCSVTHIHSSAFLGCSSLTSITIPNSVIHLGNMAFYNCSNLRSVIINTNSILDKTDAYNYNLPCIFGQQVEEYTITDGNITCIGTSAFRGCSSLISLTLPNSVTSIGNNAFEMCTSLKYITIPNNLNSIGHNIFYGCTSLQMIHVPPNKKEQYCSLGLECYRRFIKEVEDKLENSIKNIEERHLVQCQQENQTQSLPLQTNTLTSQTWTYLFFDTECNGLPQFYDMDVRMTNNWPNVIQLAWIVTDEQGNVLKRKSHIITPEGFEINDNVANLTGITTTRAMREGIELTTALSDFMSDVNNAQLLIGHNIDFDMKVVGCELYRNDMDYERLLSKNTLCTMKRSTYFCAIPKPRGKFNDYKWPKLEELHCKLFGYIFSGAHDAMSDVEATRKCYFELKKKGIL